MENLLNLKSRPDPELKLLTGEEIKDYLSQLDKEWSVDDDKLEKKFEFGSFRESINFVDKVADLAESENHHPDIKVYYKKVKIELTTHFVNGLSLNDFVVAAKIDNLNS